jgi:CheY-like chemotaxis protein
LIAARYARTRVATTGQAALDLLRDGSFDCVVMDLDVDQGGGADVLRRIRSQERLAALPVVVVAGPTMSAEQESALSRSAGSVVVKGEKARERLLDEVSLFLHSMPAAGPEEAHRVLPHSDGAHGPLAGKKVLLVDDDVRNLFAVMSILEGHGVVVETASNGREALARLEASADFDMILMDMMMPEMDGYEATRATRRIGRYEKTPIIALTARAMKGEREQCIEAGATDYLSKPLKIDQLLTLMKLWIG